VWYHTRMANSTTNEETPRPEPKGSRENRWEIACYGDAPEGDEAPEYTGYEADDERPYGWDVPEDEYPDW
jgi:hypothetical protein